ncbi:ankyrin repeat-containing domain protein [Nemania sp. NC0429]|nr:ankyrin repeat-containing domain protein [Nemania sp. NC0429]
MSGHLETVNMLLPRAPDIDRISHNNMTALHHAAEHGYYSIVSALAAEDANLDMNSGYGQHASGRAVARSRRRHRSQGQERPYPALAGRGSWTKASSQILLRQGANVRAPNKLRWTALTWATQEDDEAVVQLLLKEGAWIEVPFPEAVHLSERQ